MTDEETSRRFAALEERIAALEERMNAPPVTINMRPGGLVTRRDVYGDAKPSLAPPSVADDACELASAIGEVVEAVLEALAAALSLALTILTFDTSLEDA